MALESFPDSLYFFKASRAIGARTTRLLFSRDVEAAATCVISFFSVLFLFFSLIVPARKGMSRKGSKPLSEVKMIVPGSCVESVSVRFCTPRELPFRKQMKFLNTR